MKTLCAVFLLPLTVFGQATPAPVEAAASAPAAEVASPVPSSESWISGYMEMGYRSRSGIAGSEATYRSIVNLGEGLKLTGTDFTILDPKKRLFERLRIRAYDWGGDPWSTFHIFAEKRGIYKFLGDYRNLTYFNNLPSFADPTLSRGLVLNQQSFDTKRRMGSWALEVFNGRMFSPYVMYDRNSSSGRGVSTFRTDGNEFAIPELSRDATDLVRAGVHMTLRRFHLTAEQGASIFRSDMNSYVAPGTGINPGNNLNPVLGQPINLSSLLRATGVRGNGPFSRLTATASPVSWLDLFGHYMYANPRNEVNFQQLATGSFVALSQALFYSTGQSILSATSYLPHKSASFGWDLHPGGRFRATQSLWTDRLNSNASALTRDRLALAGNLVVGSTTSLLDTNESRVETNIFVEGPRHITFRAGHRYVWGTAQGSIIPAAGLPGAPYSVLDRQVGLAGITWRPGSRWSLAADAEVGKGSGAWFRTSLYDYQKLRATGNVKLTSSLRLSMDYRKLHNENPYSGAAYRFDVHQEAASINWMPKSERLDVQASYEHCSYNSAISYLQPQILAPALSRYREYCHTISGMVTANLPSLVKGVPMKVLAGGAAVMTAGSRPTTYYQPTARLNVPVTKRVALFGEWRYYGLDQTFYLYEAFRTHILMTGVRFSR
jgi:hypothetical protein